MNGFCTTGIAASPRANKAPSPRERPGPLGRQRQPEASAPKRVIDPDNREDPSLDREHRRARVRPQAENRREELGGLGGAVAAEEHPGEHDPELGQHDRRDIRATVHVDWYWKALSHLAP